jgi:hypothetical protein
MHNDHSDEQFQILAKQGGRRMPYENENERVADVEGESPLCWESEGIFRPETTIDLHSSFSFEAPPLSELWP